MVDRRWIKVLNDLWLYKSRTFVVIAAIALGVTGIGLVATTLKVLVENYAGQYWSSSPSQVRLSMAPFGESTLRMIRNLPEVIAVEARHSLSARIELENDKFLSLSIQALPDFNTITVDKLFYMPGAIVPPRKQGLLIERSALNSYPSLQQGDTLRIRMPDGKLHDMTIEGFVLDSVPVPTPISANIYGYVTFETAFWLENDEKGVFVPLLHQNYDRLLIITNAETIDRPSIEEKVYAIKRGFGRFLPKPPIVGSYTIPPPGKPALQDNLNSMWIVLDVAGFASLALSGFLVTNVMTALISQQIRQIGIMKAIGARRQQIISIYLMMAMILGGISLLIAIPAGAAAAYGVIHFIARVLNAEISNFYLPWETVLLQAAVSLLVPAIATIVPAMAGTNMVAREAMFSSGSGNTSYGLINRLMEPLSGLSTAITLAVRNVFRQRLRLILTLLALSLGAGTFIAVLGVRTALDTNFEALMKENNFNIQMRYRLDTSTLPRDVEREALAIPGVIRAETWKTTTLRRVFEDNSSSGSISIVAIPPNTDMLRMVPVQGQWLMGSEGIGQLFVNSDALEALGLDAHSPELLSSPIKAEMNGAKRDWQVVGVSGRTLNASAYIRMDDFDRFFKVSPTQRLLVLQTDRADKEYVSNIEAQLLDRFKAKKWMVDSSMTLSGSLSSAQGQINNVIYILLGTAALVAAVGGLGLANTLELSVMERTREIGILRSLGARSLVIRILVLTESMTICVISTLVGMLLSTPFGVVLSNLIGNTLMARRLTYDFPLDGLIIWSVIVGVLGIVASLAPAQTAIQLTVRDTLAYE